MAKAKEFDTTTPQDSSPVSREPAAPARPPSTNIATLERERARLVEEYNRQLLEIKEKLDAMQQHRGQFDQATTVEVSETPCPRNSLYKHYTYYYRWFDSDSQQPQRTATTEFCASGRCHTNDAAERELEKARGNAWQEWSNLRDRASVLQQDRNTLLTQIEELGDQIDSHRAFEELPLIGAPGSSSRLLDANFDLERLEPPAPLKPGCHLSKDEKYAQKERVLNMIRSASFPSDLVSKAPDGTLWLKGEEQEPLNSITQLISPDHLDEWDVWTEILRVQPDEIQNVTPEVLDEPKFFLWLSREASELMKVVLPKASGRVHNDARVMMKAMEVDWQLVKEFAGDEIRNDADVALEAIRWFHEPMRDTMDWIGTSPKDSAEVMQTAVMVSPNAMVHASSRLKSDCQFARAVLEDSLQLSQNVLGKSEKEVERCEAADWRVKRRLAAETRRDAPGGGRFLDVWGGVEAILDRLGTQPLDDAQTMELAVIQDGRAMQRASGRLRDSKSFVASAIETARRRLGQARSLAASVWMSKFLGEELRDDEDLARMAIEASAGQAQLDNWSDRLRSDKEFVLDALKRALFRRGILKQVAAELQADEEVVRTAMEGDGSALVEADESLREKKAFVLRAIQSSVDSGVVNELVALMRQQLGSTDAKTGQPKDHRWDAADRLLVHVKYLPDGMADDEEVVGAVLDTGGSLAGATVRLINDPEFAVQAIQRFARKAAVDQFRQRLGEHVLSQLGDKVCNSEEVMLEAVKRLGSAARYCSARLKRDARFGAQAMSASEDPKETLKHLDASFRDNDAVMHSLAEADAETAVHLASSRLKNDPGFARHAMRNSVNPDRLEGRLRGGLDSSKAKQTGSGSNSESAPPDTIRPIDVAIVVAVVVFGLVVGILMFINPMIAMFTVLVAAALGIFIFIGRMMIGDTGNDRHDDDEPTLTTRSYRSRGSDNYGYSRSGKIEPDEARGSRDFTDDG